MAWLFCLRRYLLAVGVLHLLWEFAHMPLYSLWREGAAGEIAFAAVHCTGGDLLIALSVLVLALFAVGNGWPGDGGSYRRVEIVAVVLGVAYTVFSEWLNVDVRQSWAYSELMPVVPVLGVGLSPLAQWVAIPLCGFWWARRETGAGSSPPKA